WVAGSSLATGTWKWHHDAASLRSDGLFGWRDVGKTAVMGEIVEHRLAGAGGVVATGQQTEGVADRDRKEPRLQQVGGAGAAARPGGGRAGVGAGGRRARALVVRGGGGRGQAGDDLRLGRAGQRRYRGREAGPVEAAHRIAEDMSAGRLIEPARQLLHR